MKQDDAANEPSYGVLRTSVGALFSPATAARRGDHLPLWRAWAVHLTGVVMVVIAVPLLIAWDQTDKPAQVGHYLTELVSVWADVANLFKESQTWVMILFTLVGIELGWAMSAAVTMSWSARDEPFRDSYVRALRRLCLITPHLATITLIGGGSLMGADRWLDGPRFRSLNPEMLDLARVLSQALIVATTCLWSLRVVLAAIGSDATVPVSRWPARCRECGYELAGFRRGQDCPECGVDVDDSLDPTIRPGYGPPGGLLWWIRQTYGAVRRPSTLGRRLHVTSPDPAYRRCLTFTFALLMLYSPVAMSGVYGVIEWAESLTRQGGSFDRQEFIAATCMGGVVMGLALVAATAFAALASAGLVGVIEGKRNGRNLMPAAIRAACYLSGFALVWAVVFWCNLAVFVFVMQLNLLARFAMRHNLAMEELVIAWQGGVVLLGILIYLAMIGRATRAARFANW